MHTDKLGAHISTTGGVPNAPARAKAIDATAMQLFTKQASQWRDRMCELEECTLFKTALAETAVVETCAHDSYLINLASPKPELRAKSLESFVSELQRCDALGLTYLVSHPGNYMDDRALGIARNAEAIGIGLERAPGNVMLLMETTAGTGTAIGSTFEELAELIELIPSVQRARVGVCLDTCHIFAAGYDLITDYDGVMRHFDDVLGFGRLRMMHLNDSKHGLGTHKDRHELIAEGHIGEAPFRRVMTDERLRLVAKVIETPKLDDPEATDRRMLERLRSYTT